MPQTLSRLGKTLLALTILFATLRLPLVWQLNIHWDEFLYLSRVWKQTAGTLDRSLQTFHVHLFAPLTMTSLPEYSQIFMARGFMYLLSLLSIYLIYRLLRTTYSINTALLGALAFTTLTSVIVHGSDFRADPLCLFFVLYAFYAIFKTSRTHIHSSVFSFALAVVISIKTLFFFPTYLYLIYHRRHSVKKLSLRILEFTGYLVGLFTLHLILQNQSAISSTVDAQATTYKVKPLFKILFAAIEKVFFNQGEVKGWNHFWYEVGHHIPVYALAFVGLVKSRSKLTIAFAIPLVSLLIYRNTYPYFFVMLAPSVIWLAAYSFERYFLPSPRIALLLVLSMVGFGSYTIARSLKPNNATQKAYIDLVHQAFVEPVPYIDRCGMISSFPSVGFFMSSWNIDNYRAAKRSLFFEALESAAPPRFLLSNLHCLQRKRIGKRECNFYTREDVEALKQNFVPYWGDLHVLGKRLKLIPGESIVSKIYLAGDYTNISTSIALIDAKPLQSGESVYLEKGLHTFQALGNSPTELLLRYGPALPKPVQNPPRKLFHGFGVPSLIN